MNARSFALVVAAALAAVPSAARAADKQPSPHPAPGARKPPPNPDTFVGGARMPDRERQFVGIFADTARRYEAARTASQRTDFRISEELQVGQFMRQSQDASGWLGVFKGTRSTPDGDVWFAVEIAPGLVLSTQQNRYADEGVQTLIHRYSPMRKVLDHLQVGDIVVFDATMLSMDVSNNDDMVLRPHLVVRFATIKPLEEPESAPPQ